ncbi:apolipoprotein N-acyltransferase [Helicobacter trogontum]|uniref:Apolipoprotein N-acyltransferase n=2 Tax=Helicobacter trogontum TaxID=50960 RepID=A0A4U8TL02_9HELI|nr:apolipoprotein N-acyltransferase [Helicobacter trogontum]MCI5786908.1 apolipoprotein N-acyltransferase [Helicobacter trogontum]MDY5185653.1 apolipoprotein N-acyltransferase [Helicobacter trogontum]TLD99477.1 apolipoprotein N-acyltransferase [Helicobacter trogontum]
MKKNLQQHTSNKTYNFLKLFFTTCKTEHFIILRHATTYLHITSLLQALFCYPFYIFHPRLLFKIMQGHTKQMLPTQSTKKYTKLKATLHKALIGMFFGFLFWLPFWWFILESIMPPLLYGILCFLLMCFVLYVCTTFVCLQIETRNKKLCKMSAYCTKRHIVDMALPYFIVFMVLCICIFSLLHKNIYIGVSLFYPLSIAIFLFIPRMYRFWFGFFIGVFGFYWIALALRFVESLSLLTPFIIVCVGIIYGVLLWILLYFQNLAWRITMAALLFIIHPFDFNWLNLAYLSSYSVFEASLISLLCIAFSYYFIIVKSALQLLAPLLLLISLEYGTTKHTPKLHAKIIETQYPQDMRWEKVNWESIIANNLEAIQQAIDEGYPLVILPETSFPLVLNAQTELYNTLLDLSKHITIVVGAIRMQSIESVNTHTKRSSLFMLDSLKQRDKHLDSIEESYINMPTMQNGYYNSVYIFSKGYSLIADKNILVPFGETLPFNVILSPLFKKIFGNDFGFNKGHEIISFSTQSLHVAIANCYEGTMTLPYTTGAKYILMLSNNAWFYPSTQSFMQQMIIKYYARSFQSFVYHSTNYTPTAIITPNNGKD